MTQHFTKNTVMATHWCAKCGRITEHRIDGGRLGPCIPCMEKPIERPKPIPVQGGLF